MSAQLAVVWSRGMVKAQEEQVVIPLDAVHIADLDAPTPTLWYGYRLPIGRYRVLCCPITQTNYVLRVA